MINKKQGKIFALLFFFAFFIREESVIMYEYFYNSLGDKVPNFIN